MALNRQGANRCQSSHVKQFFSYFVGINSSIYIFFHVSLGDLISLRLRPRNSLAQTQYTKPRRGSLLLFGVQFRVLSQSPHGAQWCWQCPAGAQGPQPQEARLCLPDPRPAFEKNTDSSATCSVEENLSTSDRLGLRAALCPPVPTLPTSGAGLEICQRTAVTLLAPHTACRRPWPWVCSCTSP